VLAPIKPQRNDLPTRSPPFRLILPPLLCSNLRRSIVPKWHWNVPNVANIAKLALLVKTLGGPAYAGTSLT
jgi:hypothetical protein